MQRRPLAAPNYGLTDGSPFYVARTSVRPTYCPLARRGRAAIEIALAEIEAHLPAGLVLVVRFHALGQRRIPRSRTICTSVATSCCRCGVAESMSRTSDMSNFT